ncbi:DUF5024 domain-containing protein [Parabacteroides sp. OttesenSCG-928-G07]|nr:DUF5024 domain-containing protein [Parabacteroides sp. OttesenSCG-928-G21]MDL2278171.1 DUF5024 domain-containing protein [Parabacteroides sp. OttesenSCG-928-G07]
MKTRHLFLAILLLFAGSMFTEMQAQSNIKALMKKCETMDNVDVTRIQNRTTGGKGTIITNIKFTNNRELLNEFIEALKKDDTEATYITESKVNGKMIPTFYRFKNATYFIKIDESENGASISLNEN